MIFGILMAVLVTEEMYMGTNDFLPLFANLNWWGNVMTFFTLLFQFKSANYEIAKKTAVNKNEFLYS